MGGGSGQCREKWRLSAAFAGFSAAKSHAGRVAMSQKKFSDGARRACG